MRNSKFSPLCCCVFVGKFLHNKKKNALGICAIRHFLHVWPGMLLPGHQVGVSSYEQCCWTTNVCDLGHWDSKVTSIQRPFWEHQNSENFKIMTWIQDLPHPPDLCHMLKKYKFRGRAGMCSWDIGFSSRYRYRFQNVEFAFCRPYNISGNRPWHWC